MISHFSLDGKPPLKMDLRESLISVIVVLAGVLGMMWLHMADVRFYNLEISPLECVFSLSSFHAIVASLMDSSSH